MKGGISMVKRFLATALALILALSIAACGGNGAGGTTAPTSTSSAAPGGADLGRGGESESPPTPTVPPIPPDSIWTFKGEVAHRQVLEEGYYVDYTAELDFVKLDGAYPSGQYIGDVYISLKLNAEDYIKDMLKNLPQGMASINLDAEGYGLCNAIPIHVFSFTEFQKEGTPWPSTQNSDGGQINPGAEEYVADTSFAMGFQSLLTAGAEGSTGGGAFKLGDYGFSESGEEDVKVRLIIEPDAVWGNDFYAGTGGTRKAHIFIEMNGVGLYGEGTLERLPRGEENERKQMNRERLGEKHGVDETL
jgi:hypothetical protein